MAADGLKTEVSTDILLTQTGEEGKSGVLFVEDINAFCKEQRINVPTFYTVCEVLQKRFSNMMANVGSTRDLLLTSVSKIKDEIKVLEMLIQKRDEEEQVKNMFNMAPLLFVDAVIPPQNKCYVKLSSTVIVEMTLDEALEFSKDKLDRLKKNEESFTKQFNFLRDQMTVLTLNMNRAYAYIQTEYTNQKAAAK